MSEQPWAFTTLKGWRGAAPSKLVAALGFRFFVFVFCVIFFDLMVVQKIPTEGTRGSFSPSMTGRRAPCASQSGRSWVIARRPARCRAFPSLWNLPGVPFGTFQEAILCCALPSLPEPS